MIITRSPEETMKFAQILGKHAHPGLFIALNGTIGAGKTTFTKGFVEGIGMLSANTEVTSPSYALIHELPTKIPLYHIDLYRLYTEEEIDELGMWDLPFNEIIVIMEWAEKISERLPQNRLEVAIYISANQNRTIEINPIGKYAEEIYNLIDYEFLSEIINAELTDIDNWLRVA